jgi:hypothetical protein
MGLGTSRQRILAFGLRAGAHGFKSAAEGYPSPGAHNPRRSALRRPIRGGIPDQFNACPAIHPPYPTSSSVSRSARVPG